MSNWDDSARARLKRAVFRLSAPPSPDEARVGAEALLRAWLERHHDEEGEEPELIPDES